MVRVVHAARAWRHSNWGALRLIYMGVPIQHITRRMHGIVQWAWVIAHAGCWAVACTWLVRMWLNMLELKFAIYHRATSLSSQAHSVDVCSIGWRITDYASVQTLSQQWMTKPLPVSMPMCTSEEIKWRHMAMANGSNLLVRYRVVKKWWAGALLSTVLCKNTV